MKHKKIKEYQGYSKKFAGQSLLIVLRSRLRAGKVLPVICTIVYIKMTFSNSHIFQTFPISGSLEKEGSSKSTIVSAVIDAFILSLRTIPSGILSLSSSSSSSQRV